MLVSTISIANFNLSVNFDRTHFFNSCSAKVNANSLLIYSKGYTTKVKFLPQVYRERVLDVHHQGFSRRQISQNVRVSIGYVNEVVQYYEENNSSLVGPRKAPVRNKMSADVVEDVELLFRTSMYTSELQQRLLLYGVSPPAHLPSQSAIKKCIREDCRMTKIKVSQIPKESLSQANTGYTDYFLDQIGQRDYTKPHFFDECNVIVTSGNRVYGNSYIGEPAIEIQRYDSKEKL